MTDEKTGWPLLHSKLPPAALKPLSKDVYGVEGLTDVNEAYLIQRLFASELPWDWRLLDLSYVGAEDRQGRNKDYTTRYYMAAARGELTIGERTFHGAGASDNRKIDAAYKGAATVAFKNACKIAGLTIELFKDGRAMDFIYEDRHGDVIQPTGEIPLAKAAPASQEAVQSNTGVQAVPSPESAQVTAEIVGVSVPVTAPAERSARSVGPRAKRTNVVTAPQAAEKPATAPEAAPQPPVSAEPVPAPAAAPEPLEDGKEVYLAELRQQARQVAAIVVHLRIKMKNEKNAEAINLGSEQAIALTPLTPNADSDESLRMFIEQHYPGRKLADLGEAELDGTEQSPGVVRVLQGIIDRVHEKGVHE